MRIRLYFFSALVFDVRLSSFVRLLSGGRSFSVFMPHETWRSERERERESKSSNLILFFFSARDDTQIASMIEVEAPANCPTFGTDSLYIFVYHPVSFVITKKRLTFSYRRAALTSAACLFIYMRDGHGSSPSFFIKTTRR